VKRKIVLQSATALFLLLILAVSLFEHNSKKRYETEFIGLFDTFTKIVAYTNSKEEFAHLSETIYEMLSEYHKLYDIYNDYDGINNIKTINDNAGIAPIKVNKEIVDLILFSKEQHMKTDGYVNIAFGSVLNIWHNYRTNGLSNPKNAQLPPIDLLKTAALHAEIDNVIVDEKESTVYLTDSKMSLDVGAVAKGYAAEQAAKMAKEHGFASVLISIGGNIRTVGERAKKTPWLVGVESPIKENEGVFLQEVLLSDFSLVTSGGYNRYYTADDKRYHHIINPETLYPSNYYLSVTILCKDSGVADALSTAVFNMPFNEGFEFIDKMPDTEGLWVLNTGEVKYSKNFNHFLSK